MRVCYYFPKLMNVLLDDETPASVKEEIIEKDFGIPMTEEVKAEVINMCNMSDGIYEKGIERGIRTGRDSRTCEIIDRMINRNASDEYIMDVTGESREFIAQRRKILEESKLTTA